MSNFEKPGAATALHVPPQSSRRSPAWNQRSGIGGGTGFVDTMRHGPRRDYGQEVRTYLNLIMNERVGGLTEEPDLMRHTDGRRGRRQRQRGLVRMFWAEQFLELERVQRDGPPAPDLRRVSRSSRGLRQAIDLIAEAWAPRGLRALRVGSVVPEEVFLRRPCARALLSWVNAYERAEPADPHGRSRRGRPVTRADLEVQTMMARVIAGYASESRPTKSALYLSLCEWVSTRNAALPPKAERLRLPGWQTFLRRMNMLDRFEVDRIREGAARKRAGSGFFARPMPARRVGEVVSLGGGEVPVRELLILAGLWEHLSSRGRVELMRKRAWSCVSVDAASRAVLGMTITLMQGPDAVMDVLRMTMSDKGFHCGVLGEAPPWPEGVLPETIVTEVGSNLVSGDAREVVTGLGISVATGPDARSIISRFICGWLGARHSPVWTHVAELSAAGQAGGTWGEYEARSTFDADELCAVLVRHAVGHYQNSPHPELGGETPAAAFRRLRDLHGQRPLPDAVTMATMFGP